MDAMALIKEAVATVDAKKVAKLDKVLPTTEIRALGMDSVATMEMVAFIEDKLNVQFADEVLTTVTTFGDLVKLIETSKK